MSVKPKDPFTLFRILLTIVYDRGKFSNREQSATDRKDETP